MERYLYRGVNSDLYARTGGRLEPRTSGRPFKRTVYYGEEVYFGDGSVFGDSETNAVLMHQRDSSKYRSSGISTTPHFENASAYATHNNQSGNVYKIDRERLKAADVKEYVVDDYAMQAAIPGDQEIILVARDYGTLPAEIVVAVINVSPAAIITTE